MTGEVLEGLNPESLMLRVQAPERWRDVEQRLRARGLTLGWVPAVSTEETLGELLEGRAVGLRSSLYGDLAASCIAVEAVLANGEPVASRVVPRSAAGPDWKHLLLGGQGRTGRISSATVRVYPVPEAVVPAAYAFSGLEAAIRALGALLHRGAIPAVAAVVPAEEGVRVLLTFEGNPALSRAREAIATRLCAAGGGRACGPEPVEAWLEAVGAGESASPLRSPLLRPAVRVDAGWSALPALVHEARSVVGADWCITHLRHAAAALLVGGPLSEEERTALVSRLEAAGGRSPSTGPASGPVGRRLAGELAGASS